MLSYSRFEKISLVSVLFFKALTESHFHFVYVVKIRLACQ